MPIINNYPGWVADLITSNNCGLLVDPDDSVSFAEALILLADNKNLSKSMSINAELLAQNKFDRNILSEKFVSYIESFMAN